MTEKETQEIIVGGGCFWCTEAIFNAVKGVEKVISGYSGGTVPGTPTYREVCSGLTGHAEVIKVTFNPSVISLKELLIIFVTSHDPTTLNRQGADVGTQYRSVIFINEEQQKNVAEAVIKTIQPYFEDKIVTEIKPLKQFFPAEEVHQNYDENNKTQAYCTAVISPKLKKLKQMYASKLKND